MLPSGVLLKSDRVKEAQTYLDVTGNYRLLGNTFKSPRSFSKLNLSNFYNKQNSYSESFDNNDDDADGKFNHYQKPNQLQTDLRLKKPLCSDEL